MNRKNEKWNFVFVEKGFVTDEQKCNVKGNSVTNTFGWAKGEPLSLI